MSVNVVIQDSMLNGEDVSPLPDLYSQRATLPLHILVVGCGLGGLAAAHCLVQAGHSVTMIEAAPAIGEVGAGIQVSPNVSRLLQRWGLRSALKKVAVKPEAIVLRRYDTGERLAYTRVAGVMDREYGAPYYHVHRADFHKLLCDLVTPRVTLRLGSVVVSVDPSRPSITLASGEVISGDLLIGADGVKSVVQQFVTGQSTPARATGDAAYRAIIPASHLLADPELRSLVEHPEMTGWMAPGRHLMAYLIRGKQEYNMVLLHPDDGSVESWTAEGSADKMRAEFADFEPRVKKILHHVDSTLKWRLMDRHPLESWVHKDGRVALLGDACHPMLPYRAQGAAMAIEDAAVLGHLFSHLSSASQIAPLLHAYQELRHSRATATQLASTMNQKIFHLPDGPEQEKRDEEMRRAMEVELRLAEDELEAGDGGDLAWEATYGNINQWGDKQKSRTQYGYDADREVERWWAQTGEQLLKETGEEMKQRGKL